MNDNDGNVHILSTVTTHDVPADRILVSAIGKLDCAIVIGYDKNGEEYFASSLADGGSALWLVERFKLALLTVSEE